ncbi:alpha/beta fold hydrolase [Vibrio panuliri]|uniref:Lysophospholipase n=1 Tax=Vibrio panuliri TaxID=1381081 RepID=A0ABX3FFN8_9VIBR|nr:alpha/beta fold hydrolase [Vibrio panuliri]KAB1460991.1 alpha/beta fold hydrolase [Vibrio panuliri]OLQ89813.1 lysophospholipase [Vibrio panuliri]
MTTNSAVNPCSYTQETTFEQVISNEIAEFWAGRKQGYLRTPDKRNLYWISLTSEQHTRSIVVVNGRIESSYKYQELFYDLFRQGYNIYSYDHRGQGCSDRLVKNHDIGYVEEFDDYVEDLAQLVELFDLGRYQKRFLLGHSMGGNIVTRYVQTHPEHPFDAMALSAPMFGVNVAWYLKPIARWIGQILTALHAEPNYAPGQAPYYSKPFEGNLLSQSEIRYQWFRRLYEDKPELQVGGASTRWVWQGLIACKQAILLTRQVKIPLLLLQAGSDKIVANEAQVQFAKKLAKTNANCQLKVIHDARHELFFEQDKYRNQALDITLDFFSSH